MLFIRFWPFLQVFIPLDTTLNLYFNLVSTVYHVCCCFSTVTFPEKKKKSYWIPDIWSGVCFNGKSLLFRWEQAVERDNSEDFRLSLAQIFWKTDTNCLLFCHTQCELDSQCVLKTWYFQDSGQCKSIQLCAKASSISRKGGKRRCERVRTDHSPKFYCR